MYRKKPNTTKRIFLRSKKNYRGGDVGAHTQELNQDPDYPAVYGIDNKTVLYPISKYGEPAGFFDPPVNSNGPYGNGPINGPYLGMGGKRSMRKRMHSMGKRMHSMGKRSMRNMRSIGKRTMRNMRSIGKRTMRKRSILQGKRTMRSIGKRTIRQGKRSMRKVKRSIRGGGSPSNLLPQTIVNTERGLMQSVYETANGFSGHTNSASLNPMPYNQPIDEDVTYLRTDFPNVAQNYNKADAYVSSTF
jgi:hypothetical protein